MADYRDDRPLTAKEIRIIQEYKDAVHDADSLGYTRVEKPSEYGGQFEQNMLLRMMVCPECTSVVQLRYAADHSRWHRSLVRTDDGFI